MTHVARTRREVIVGASLGLAAGALGCGGEREPTLERLRRTGRARVGYANEAPYAFLDSETGELTGEAPEVARVVLGRLGCRAIEGVMTEFGALIPGLKAGRFDLIAAGMYITPDRARAIAFTQPTYAIGEAFVVLSGNPLSLHSYADVAAHEDARLGVVTGTVERGYARETGIPDARVLTFPDAPSALEGVRGGRVDAYAGTSLTIAYLLERAGDDRIERAEPFTDPVIDGRAVRGYGAFGVRFEDRELVDALDAELDAFIGTPAHLALVRPFGFKEADLPGDVRTADLIAR